MWTLIISHIIKDGILILFLGKIRLPTNKAQMPIIREFHFSQQFLQRNTNRSVFYHSISFFYTKHRARLLGWAKMNAINEAF